MITPNVDERVALVTGSSKGVGRELLLSLADCGADVAVHYHSSEEEARGSSRHRPKAGCRNDDRTGGRH